jgi:hypothetical protein
MTDLEINQKIAEVVFNLPVKRGTRRGKFDPEGVCLWYEAEHHGGEAVWKRVPDYVNSLDAMHEAEKVIRTIKGVLIYDYAARISKSHHYDELLTATARQKAEAFLKTLGKWNTQQDH